MTTDQRTDVTELIYRLYACMDESRFADLHSVFTDDISVRTPGGLASGRDAVVAQATRGHSTGHRVQHFVHNPIVRVDGDHATVRADVIVTFTPEGQRAPAPQYTLSERFHYETVRTPGGWRVSHVDGTPVWTVGTRPQAG
ncbi:nuclear transport factor 2 family protein [Nonomuraea sp. PA05]|uniref:nuclear transport factor 2 family protein n=1 Tax=Nonomuraea sp. PA05 TaxID=2604466 RepID=UPI0011D845CD|nr:nuclear transport factor 2 family protein [Nonomuraea sp. PA05]TYB61389.1 nuclear transport factor 2 family protein [Nonomuraea sp. PA05]